ncbi:MAG: isochorismate synthase [bacterium]|nr:isochorismate synthase [bacterium]
MGHTPSDRGYETTPLEAFSCSKEPDRVFWKPPEGEALAGLGSSESIQVDGPERFEAAAVASEQLLAPGQFAFAGFAFADSQPPNTIAPESPESPDNASRNYRLWDGYPSGLLLLPKQVIRGNAAMSHTSQAPSSSSNLTDTDNSTGNFAGSNSIASLNVQDTTRDAFQNVVKLAANDIEANKLSKVVVARQVDATGTINAAEVLDRLCARFDSCAVFGFGRGPLCFLGASPELLLNLEDNRVTTCAVAGTAPRGATPQEDQENAQRLASNAKEQDEHRYVVEYLRTCLALADVDLDPVGPTTVKTLPGVHHLSTQITGRIAPQPGLALRLVGALHPTPAVGGTPTTMAQQWISQHEQLNRGWYAGPVGWIDHRGCGSFYVALRSALASPTKLRLFAGAGIVAGSNPERELAETDLKLAAILDVVT